MRHVPMVSLSTAVFEENLDNTKCSCGKLISDNSVHLTIKDTQGFKLKSFKGMLILEEDLPKVVYTPLKIKKGDIILYKSPNKRARNGVWKVISKIDNDYFLLRRLYKKSLLPVIDKNNDFDEFEINLEKHSKFIKKL